MPKFQTNSLYQLPDEKAKSSCTWDQSLSHCRSPSKSDTLYSELSRSRSPMKFSSEGEQHYRLTEPPAVPPRLSSMPRKPVESFVPRLEKTDPCLPPSGLGSVEESHIYHLACSPCNAVTEGSSLAMEEHSDSVYDDLVHEAPFSRFPKDKTYEMMPGFKDAVPEFFSNVYESLDNVWPKSFKVSTVLKCVLIIKNIYNYPETDLTFISVHNKSPAELQKEVVAPWGQEEMVKGVNSLMQTFFHNHYTVATLLYI